MGDWVGGDRMNISTESLNKLIKEWDKSIHWTDEELETIRNHLVNISLNNGGRIQYDIKLFFEFYSHIS